MSDFQPEVKQTATCCEPCEPCPTPQSFPPCEGDITGSITGKLVYECCCPQIRTRTFHHNIGPQAEPALLAFLLATTVAWESGGYMIHGHSLTDVGAGWLYSLTIGWYA